MLLAFLGGWQLPFLLALDGSKRAWVFVLFVSLYTHKHETIFRATRRTIRKCDEIGKQVHNETVNELECDGRSCTFR